MDTSPFIGITSGRRVPGLTIDKWDPFILLRWNPLASKNRARASQSTDAS
jgi:hypothetical protein